VTWLILTLVALSSRGIYGVLSKVMGPRLEASGPITAIVMLTGVGLLAIPLSPALGGLSTRGLADHWAILLLIVATSGAGNMAYFHGIRTLDAGVAQIVFSSIIVWGLLLSVLVLNSRFAWVQVAGALLLVFAIVIAQLDDRLRIRSGAWFILVAAALFAVFQVCVARISDDVTAGTYLVITNLGPAAFIALAYGKRTVPELRQMRSTIRAGAVVSFATVLFSLSYFVAAYFAYRAAPDAGVVVILLTAQVVVAVLLSAAFLDERKHLGRKIAAGALAVVAGFLIHR
jgi:drug/metabolite transporter (DMT)-like permease